jgi:hypothetical protein
MSARKRTPPSPAKFSPSFRPGISPNMAPLKRLDTSESPASRQSRLSCPIETHLSMRGASSSSRIGPNAEASSSKRRGGRLSSAQRGFLSALGGKKKPPPRSPHRPPVPVFKEQPNQQKQQNQQQMQTNQESSGDFIMSESSSSTTTSTTPPAPNSTFFSSQPPMPIASTSPKRRTVHRSRSGSTNTSSSKWPRAEDEQLRQLVVEMGTNDWERVSSRMHTKRTPEELAIRWGKIQNHTRGPWTPLEDAKMIELVQSMGGAGKIKWSTVADSLPGRVGKQCRERWFNHLDPSVKKGDWTPEEDDIIFEMQKQRGNKWSEIARLVRLFFLFVV